MTRRRPKPVVTSEQSLLPITTAIIRRPVPARQQHDARPEEQKPRPQSDDQRQEDRPFLRDDEEQAHRRSPGGTAKQRADHGVIGRPLGSPLGGFALAERRSSCPLPCRDDDRSDSEIADAAKHPPVEETRNAVQYEQGRDHVGGRTRRDRSVESEHPRWVLARGRRIAHTKSMVCPRTSRHDSVIGIPLVAVLMALKPLHTREGQALGHRASRLERQFETDASIDMAFSVEEAPNSR